MFTAANGRIAGLDLTGPTRIGFTEATELAMLLHTRYQPVRSARETVLVQPNRQRLQALLGFGEQPPGDPNARNGNTVTSGAVVGSGTVVDPARPVRNRSAQLATSTGAPAAGWARRGIAAAISAAAARATSGSTLV